MYLPKLHTTVYKDFIAYEESQPVEESLEKSRYLFQQKSLSISKNQPLVGYCCVSEELTRFLVSSEDAERINYREELISEACGLNNRLRACFHYFKQTIAAKLKPDDRVYLPEQRTRFFETICSIHKNTIGSEYLGTTIPLGSKNYDGIRNEDVTELTIDDSSIKSILCFEVLEHVPDYKSALAEFYRVLESNGSLMITVPFLPDSQTTKVRAKLSLDGTLTHIEEPEYHGDPNSTNPCLCFYHFGWSLLEDIKEAGFSNVELHKYWEPSFGYLGNHQSFIFAEK